jgi:CRISPR-associated protein (TIGR03984 family)
MTREIINTAATCAAVKMDGFVDEPIQWLAQQMHSHKLKYLLAHDEYGVIWGRLDGEELITSHDVAPKYSPPLRPETLQTARLFAPAGELLVWRDEAGAWAGRLITEGTPGATAEWTEAFDEQQVLWGTKADSRERDFTLMSDGSQGLFHVVPLALIGHFDEQTRPLRLVVRHYLKADDYGFVRINISRLRSLFSESKENKV